MSDFKTLERNSFGSLLTSCMTCRVSFLINPVSELPYSVLEVQFYVSTWKHPSVNRLRISPPGFFNRAIKLWNLICELIKPSEFSQH